MSSTPPDSVPGSPADNPASSIQTSDTARPEEAVTTDRIGTAPLTDDADVLPSRMEAILERLPNPERREAEVIIRQMVAQYSGPVPHAGEMARYKEIDNSFPERFVRMAERQIAHRHSLETKVVEGDYKLKRRGQDYALVSVVFGLLVALIFGLIGLQVVAGIVAGTTVLGVVTAFVVGRVTDNKSTENEAEPEKDS